MVGRLIAVFLVSVRRSPSLSRLRYRSRSSRVFPAWERSLLQVFDTLSMGCTLVELVESWNGLESNSYFFLGTSTDWWVPMLECRPSAMGPPERLYLGPALWVSAWTSGPHIRGDGSVGSSAGVFYSKWHWRRNQVWNPDSVLPSIRQEHLLGARGPHLLGIPRGGYTFQHVPP